MFTTKRKLYSQNFLCNRQLVQKLVRSSSVGSNDTVLEIGAGNGIITQQLLKQAKEVIAIEIDSSFVNHLREKFTQTNNLDLIQADFLDLKLPSKPYKVFANIPFNKTADIVRKLLLSSNPPADCYLVLQKEAAEKLIPKIKENYMTAMLHFPWWEVKIEHQFKRNDFYPMPSIEVVLLRIDKRSNALLDEKNKTLFFDFIAYNFIKKQKAKNIPPKQWVKAFSVFANNPYLKGINRIKGSFARLQNQQNQLQKIHRTRVDKNWKKFKKKSD